MDAAVFAVDARELASLSQWRIPGSNDSTGAKLQQSGLLHNLASCQLALEPVPAQVSGGLADAPPDRVGRGVNDGGGEDDNNRAADDVAGAVQDAAGDACVGQQQQDGDGDGEGAPQARARCLQLALPCSAPPAPCNTCPPTSFRNIFATS